MDKVYSEWSLQGDVIAVPPREVLLVAYKDAMATGDLSKTFASVFIARAYVAGLNKRYGDDAYAVGVCTVPLDASHAAKMRMMFAWQVATGYKGRMGADAARVQAVISDSLGRISRKYLR